MTFIWLCLGAFCVIVAYGVGYDHARRDEHQREDDRRRLAAEEHDRATELQHRGLTQSEIQQREALKRRATALRHLREYEDREVVTLERLYNIPAVTPDHEQQTP